MDSVLCSGLEKCKDTLGLNAYGIWVFKSYKRCGRVVYSMYATELRKRIANY